MSSGQQTLKKKNQQSTLIISTARNYFHFLKLQTLHLLQNRRLWSCNQLRGKNNQNKSIIEKKQLNTITTTVEWEPNKSQLQIHTTTC